MTTSEKFCLKWNDFKENIGSAFGSMRNDRDFSNVTLACEDGQQVEAHKVILSASSPFFHHLLKTNKHSHPIIIMRGLKYEELVAIIDFLYHGEANIYQENLDVFLNLAEELQLKGLTGGGEDRKHNEPAKQQPKAPTNQTINKDYIIDIPNKKSKDDIQDTFMSEGTIAIQDQLSSGNFHELDEQIKTMMATGLTHLGKKGFVRVCKVCGKEGNWQNIKDHIEANHINGVSIPCNLCEKTFRSRQSLRFHKSSNHK